MQNCVKWQDYGDILCVLCLFQDEGKPWLGGYWNKHWVEQISQICNSTAFSSCWLESVTSTISGPVSALNAVTSNFLVVLYFTLRQFPDRLTSVLLNTQVLSLDLQRSLSVPTLSGSTNSAHFVLSWLSDLSFQLRVLAGLCTGPLPCASSWELTLTDGAGTGFISFVSCHSRITVLCCLLKPVLIFILLLLNSIWISCPHFLKIKCLSL